MEKSPPMVYLFTALPCEAKPLQKHWQLAQSGEATPFNVYRKQAFVLTVSGPGKQAMAAAVAYTLAMYPARNPILLNIGIAGHARLALGHLCLVDQVLDREEPGKRFYPQWLGENDIERKGLVTSVNVAQTYSDDDLHDMEASAFYEIAVKFSSLELIQCLKIVSDNEQAGVAAINAKAVTAWVEAQIMDIERVIAQLRQLREQLEADNDEALLERLCAQYHFSVSRRHQLKTLLQRWRLISPQGALPEAIFDCHNGKQFIQRLQYHIDRQPFYL